MQAQVRISNKSVHNVCTHNNSTLQQCHHKIFITHYYYYTDAWVTQTSPVDVRPFTQPTGLAVNVPNDPADLFSLFFTPEIVHSIVEETNRYAAQCLAAAGKSTTWTTDEQEIRAYFGFYILMGMVKEPKIRDYWSNDPTFHYSPIADRISRNRFEEISRYLHFVDNQNLPARGAPGHHRLQQVKPVVDTLRERFSAVYHPGANLSVDEAMIPFKGK